MTHETVDHEHGAQGDKPAQDLDFQDGDYPDPETFDWFWSEVPAAINSHADALDAIDSDQDGKVDAAESADTAANATAYKTNDIDSDGDGIVDEADLAAETRSFEARTNYPANPEAGRVVFRTDKTS